MVATVIVNLQGRNGNAPTNIGSTVRRTWGDSLRVLVLLRVGLPLPGCSVEQPFDPSLLSC